MSKINKILDLLTEQFGIKFCKKSDGKAIKKLPTKKDPETWDDNYDSNNRNNWSLQGPSE